MSSKQTYPKKNIKKKIMILDPKKASWG